MCAWWLLRLKGVGAEHNKCRAQQVQAQVQAQQVQAQVQAQQVQSFRACGASDFCLGKSHQNRCRLARSGAIQPHRFPALLAMRGTAPKLASLRQGRLFGRA